MPMQGETGSIIPIECFWNIIELCMKLLTEVWEKYEAISRATDPVKKSKLEDVGYNSLTEFLFEVLKSKHAKKVDTNEFLTYTRKCCEEVQEFYADREKRAKEARPKLDAQRAKKFERESNNQYLLRMRKEEDERQKRQHQQAGALQLELAGSENFASRQREAHRHQTANQVREQIPARAGMEKMDFEGIDQRGNLMTRKTPPPSTPPPAKKKANPAEEKEKTETQKKDRQEGIELEREKFRLQSEIKWKQKELESIEKKQAKKSGLSGSKRVVVTKEQIMQQAPTSAHSSPRSSGAPSRKPDKEKEEKTAPVSSTPSTKEPVKKRSTLLAALPVNLRPPSPDLSEVASESQGQTGKFDKQPSSTASQKAKVQKQLEKGILQFDQMEIEDVLPGPTPSEGLLTGVGAEAFRSLTQNPLNAKMDLTIPVFGGDGEETGETEQVSLDLTKCSTDVPEQLSDMAKVLRVSNPHLMPTEVNVILESCAQVFIEADASEANARNLTWAIVRNILRWCGKLEDILAFGAFSPS